MKINKIKINSYGKLKEKEINFKDGINLIYGQNEAGKSTLIKFITNSLYGISKNKKGKEVSDFDKYKPWSGEEFSGKLEYELDNKEKYEIYRDFSKKNPKIFNENMEDISKEFNIDKNKGNEFFYEQTKIDEDLFLSTLAINQSEVKLENQAQNFLIQKIANLAQTGDDSISFKRVMDRINRRQLDEVGTERSREKPINIVARKLQELNAEKENLEKFKNFKYEYEEQENDLDDEILNLENENNFLKEIKLQKENEKIENEKIKIKENIEICEYMTMVDLISKDNTVCGIIAMDRNDQAFPVYSQYVVLACGGIGGLFKNSTNFSHIAGDGVGIAMKHHVEMENLDYIQIHPTTLYSKKPGRRFLVSESVRGEGALLYDKNGQRFTNELQPRDLLSQKIFAQMEKDGTEFVWEDMRPLGEKTILEHFPHIYEQCVEEGFDPRKEPIPVVPAQHYFMGGIKVNLGSKTSMKGLYACGETSCNGVHGRNRLASNSLLESLVFARKAADDMIFGQTPEYVRADAIDMNMYESREELLNACHETVLKEIERMKKSHE